MVGAGGDDGERGAAEQGGKQSGAAEARHLFQNVAHHEGDAAASGVAIGERLLPGLEGGGGDKGARLEEGQAVCSFSCGRGKRGCRR